MAYDSVNNRFTSFSKPKYEEGDDCPNCGIGTIILSGKGNLYCSELCWKEDGKKE